MILEARGNHFLLAASWDFEKCRNAGTTRRSGQNGPDKFWNFEILDKGRGGRRSPGGALSGIQNKTTTPLVRPDPGS